MTESQKENLKTKLALLSGIPPELAEIYLELAVADVLDQTNRVELLPPMLPLVLEVARTYVTRGQDKGISARSEGAISISYASELDPGLLARIHRYRLMNLARKEADRNA